MDWEFDAFLDKANNLSSEQDQNSPIVPLKKKARPFLLAAASVALLAALLTGYLMNSTNGVKMELADQKIKAAILSETQSIMDENEFQSQANEPTHLSPSSLSDSLNPKEFTAKDEQEVLNAILPSRGRLKKERKVHYVEREALKQKKSEQVMAPSTSSKGYQDNYVIINGQKIDSEKEAIEITKYSLRVLSDKVSQSVAKADASFENVEF